MVWSRRIATDSNSGICTIIYGCVVNYRATGDLPSMISVMCSTERHYRVKRLLQKQEVYFGKASHFRFALKEIIILNRLPSVETLSFLVWICSTELDWNLKWVQNCRTLRKWIIYDFIVYVGTRLQQALYSEEAIVSHTLISTEKCYTSTFGMSCFLRATKRLAACGSSVLNYGTQIW